MTSTVLDPRRIEADYLIETSIDPRVAAEIIAGEQSSGTFRAVPRETPQLKERAAARIEKIEILREQLRWTMFLTGSKNLTQLQNAPLLPA